MAVAVDGGFGFALEERLEESFGSLRPGERVTAKRRLYDSRGRTALKKGETAEVTKVEAAPNHVTVKAPSGKEFSGLRPSWFLVKPSVSGEASSDTALRAKLVELAELRDEGLITEEEFAAKKRQVLGLEKD